MYFFPLQRRQFNLAQLKIIIISPSAPLSLHTVYSCALVLLPHLYTRMFAVLSTARAYSLFCDSFLFRLRNVLCSDLSGSSIDAFGTAVINKRNRHTECVLVCGRKHSNTANIHDEWKKNDQNWEFLLLKSAQIRTRKVTNYAIHVAIFITVHYRLINIHVDAQLASRTHTLSLALKFVSYVFRTNTNKSRFFLDINASQQTADSSFACVCFVLLHRELFSVSSTFILLCVAEIRWVFTKYFS